MKRLITLLFMSVVISGICGYAAESAESILGKAASRINAAKSVTAEYVISSGQSSEKGRLTMASGKFALTSPSLRTWYDGLTMWTYSPALDEVNITTPTAGELLEVNPFAVINNYKTLYSPRLLKSTSDGYMIEMTPLHKGQTFSKAVVTINKESFYPSHIRLTLADRSTVDIDIKSVRSGDAISIDTFRFKKSDAPKAEIIDLR